MAPRATLGRERALWARGFHAVAGLDEVGRGPLAGPVVAAVVVLPPGRRAIPGLRDSKQLSAAQRERLGGMIRRAAAGWAVGAASVREIDRVNIRRATILAFQRALARLVLPVDYILVDGMPLPELGRPHEAVVDGRDYNPRGRGLYRCKKCGRVKSMRHLRPSSEIGY